MGANPRSRLWLVLVIVAGVSSVLAMVALSLYESHRQSVARYQRNQRARELKSWQQVKSGESNVTVYGTPEILEMLAADPDCVRNLDSVYFFMCDLSDPRYEVLTKLTNVDDIGIYDCRGIDVFLSNIAGMVSLESIYFESIFLEGEMLKRLAALPNLKRVHFERRLEALEVQVLKQSLPHATIEYTDSLGTSIIEQPDGS